MKQLLEVHLLQNFAPSNLNRDDTGAPKDAIFGGYRRARVSSQCFKRSIRKYMRDNALLPLENQAVRTKGAVEELKKRLSAMGRDPDQAIQKATVSLMGFKLKTKEGNKTEYVLFLGEQELSRIAGLIHQHWDEIVLPEPEEASSEGAAPPKKKAAKKKASAEGVPDELRKALIKTLDGGKAVDLALFGRMLADYPAANENAACQVAHALSTHKMERAFDFYTAVDDLNTGDSTGADMMGTVEFNSACFYRYVALDLQQLKENLHNDAELTRDGISAFLKALVKAKPTGKQNSFAAHNDPEYVVVTIREQADPRSLANAFEKPVSIYQEPKWSLTEASIIQFEKKWEKLEKAYGTAEHQNALTLRLNLTDYESKLGQSVETFDELIQKSIEKIATFQES